MYYEIVQGTASGQTKCLVQIGFWFKGATQMGIIFRFGTGGY